MVSRYRDAAVRKLGAEFFSPENSFGAPVSVPGRRAEQASWGEVVQWMIDTSGRARGDADQHWSLYR